MSFTRKTLAAAIDEYDEQIELLNDGKRDTYVDYRAQLAEAGMDKEQVAEELAAFKKALRKRRARKEDPIKVDREDDLVDEILAEIEGASRVAHARVENIEEFPSERGTKAAGESSAVGDGLPSQPPAGGGSDNAGKTTPPLATFPCKHDSTQGKNASDPEGAKSETTPVRASPAEAREGGNIAHGKSEEAVDVPSPTEPEARMPRASSPPVSTKKLPVPGPENGRFVRNFGGMDQRDIPENLRRDGNKAQAGA